MWLYPVSSYLALAFLVLVVGLMAYFPDTRGVALLWARCVPGASRRCYFYRVQAAADR